MNSNRKGMVEALERQNPEPRQVLREATGYVNNCPWNTAAIIGVEKELFRPSCKPIIVLPRWCLDEFKFCPFCGKEIKDET